MIKKDLSKVQISKPEENSRTTVKNVRCSVCDEVSKSVLRLCDSGHWARQTFQPGQIPKSKSLNNIGVNEKAIRGRYSIPEEKGIKKITETTIKYKNVNFCDSESLPSIPGSNGHETIKNGPEKSADIMHRPITCPISDCRKMIARASILQHFIFDHSKVPRITLNVDELQRVFINVSAITQEVRSYALFLVNIDAPLVHTVDSNTLMNGGNKNASFLLMGVRMQTAELIKKPHGGECISIRHAQTQTVAPVKSSKVCLEPKATKDSIVVGGVERHLGHLADHHDVILLWVCKLVHDVTLYYNISIRRLDRKLGYSFTGETLNIADFFERQLYEQVECLRILGKSSIKLMNEQNELEVIVNIFK